jgi:hypothetical protein
MSNQSPTKKRMMQMFRFNSPSAFKRARKVTNETKREHMPARSVRSKAAMVLRFPKRSKDPIHPVQDTLTFIDHREARKILRSLGFMHEIAMKYMETVWWQQIVMAMSVMMNTKDHKNTKDAQHASTYFYNHSTDYLQMYHHMKSIRNRLVKLAKYQWRNAQNAVKYKTIRDWFNTMNQSFMEPLQLHFNELLNTGFVARSLRKFKRIPLHMYMRLKHKMKPEKLHVVRMPLPKKK